MPFIFGPRKTIAVNNSFDNSFLRIPYATNYNSRGFNLYASVFNPGSYVRGQDFDASWRVNTKDYPNNVYLDWYLPDGPIPNSGGVWGYHHLRYNLPNAAPIANLINLSFTAEWDYTGDGTFNVLEEMWVGPSADSPAFTTNPATPNAALFELGRFARCDDYTFHNGGVLIGTTHTNNGVVYTCRRNTRFITFAPQSETDVKATKFEWREALDYLIFHGAITGSEYVSGPLMIGIEPTTKAGTGIHGGTWQVKSISTSYSTNLAPLNADYLGANVFTNGNSLTTWSTVGFSAPVAAPDMDGGNTAATLMELSAGSTTHSILKDGSFITVPSRQMDYVLFEHIRADKGRTKFQHYVANGDGGTAFTSQIKTGYDTVTAKAVSDVAFGSLVVPIGPMRQVIDAGNGWYYLVTVFRKVAGVTQLFIDFGIKNDALETEYVGDVTKGVTLRIRHRLIEQSKIVITGTPDIAATGTAYSFTPITIGGKSPLLYSFIGSLPSGWSINTSTGQVSGTTASAGTVNGTIRVTGNDGIVENLDTSFIVTPPPLTSFDPATKSSTVNLSETNRRMIVVSGSNQGAKGTSYKNTGLLQAELKISVVGNSSIGVGNVNADMTGWLAINANGIGVNPTTGDVSQSGTNQGPAGTGTFVNNDVLGILFNFTTRKLRFGKNGVYSATEFNMPTGDLTLAATGGPGVSVIMSTETSQMAYPLQSGYSQFG